MKLTKSQQDALDLLKDGPNDLPTVTAKALLRRGLIEEMPRPIKNPNSALERCLCALNPVIYKLKKSN